MAGREYKKFVSSLEGIEYVKKSFVKDKEVDKQIPATKVLMEKTSME